MTPASQIASASNTSATGFKARTLALLREMWASYARYSELQVMLSSGYGYRQGAARAKRAK